MVASDKRIGGWSLGSGEDGIMELDIYQTLASLRDNINNKGFMTITFEEFDEIHDDEKVVWSRE